MTDDPTFSDFAAALRGFMRFSSPPAGSNSPNHSASHDAGVTPRTDSLSPSEGERVRVRGGRRLVPAESVWVNRAPSPRPSPPSDGGEGVNLPAGRRIPLQTAKSQTFSFDDLALKLFHLQFAHNAAYQTFCQHRGAAPGGVESWRDIPAVPTVAFKELELTSLPPVERTAVFHSSGTTEQRPSRHFHHAESLALYEASLLAWFPPHLLPDAAQTEMLVLTPPPEQAPHSSLAHMFGAVRKKFGTASSHFAGRLAPNNSWELDFAQAAQSLSSAQREGRPLLVLGTAFSFVHLLDQLGSAGTAIKLPPGSRVLETGGYKGRSRALPKEDLHRLITATLGVPRAKIVCEYGMSELSSQAYDTVAGRGGARVFQFPPWARTLVVSPETGREVAEGETGLLRVFDLANVRSVMAIQTEDLAVRRGDGFELIGRAAQAELRGCSLMAA